jgi:hypothetical protein
MIACQMSLYPLGTGDFTALISDAVDSLEPCRTAACTSTSAA